jgi:hypothetical protein
MDRRALSPESTLNQRSPGIIHQFRIKPQTAVADAISAAQREVAPLTAERDAAVERRTAARGAAAQREGVLETQIK